MKYLRYLAYAIAIQCALYVLLALLSSADYAFAVSIITAPVALWSGRLIEAKRSGIITRRMAMLDGGPTRAGHFWSFRPDIYRRQKGFDNFKGYLFKECMCGLLLWTMFLSVSIIKILSDAATPV